MSNENFTDLQTTDLTITRGNTEKTFRVSELSKLDSQAAFDISKLNGKRDPEKVRKLDSRLIAKAVKEVVTVDGQATLRDIPFAEAEKYPLSLSRQLVSAVLDINGIGGEDADEKN